jgi:hypothetical protein
MRNATGRKMVPTRPQAFLVGQLLAMNPVSALVFLAGAATLIILPVLRPWRIMGIVFGTVFAILLTSGTAKDYYLSPAYPFLLAPGAIAAGTLFTRSTAWRRAGYAFAALTLATGILIAPFAIPILGEEDYIRYAKAAGIQPPQQERIQTAELPQYYADMHGWPEMVDSVARVYRTLTPEEQAGCAIYCQNYGEAGAIDVLGRKAGLPPAMSGHNSYWLWGPKGNGSVVIVIGGNPEDHRKVFETVTPAGSTGARYAIPYEVNRTIYICRKLKVPLEEVWPRTKVFI